MLTGQRERGSYFLALLIVHPQQSFTLQAEEHQLFHTTQQWLAVCTPLVVLFCMSLVINNLLLMFGKYYYKQTTEQTVHSIRSMMPYN